MTNADEQLAGGIVTANEAFFDALVRHQVFLLRFSGGLSKALNTLLLDTEENLAALLLQLPNERPASSPAARRRLMRRLEAIQRLRGAAWEKALVQAVGELRDLTVAEANFMKNALERVVPIVIDLDVPSANLLKALVGDFPVHGKTLEQWITSAKEADIDGIEQIIQRGMVQGLSNQDIAREIVGTASLQGADGLTQSARRNIAAIVRTATNAYSNQARRMMLDEFAGNGIFDEELYVATLDARTTPICRSLDGKRFPVAEGPLPPLHMNCRSLRVAVIDGQVVGTRPAKPTSRRLLLDEYTERNNLPRARNRDALPRGHKGLFDQYERGRLRELIGPVPAKTSYGEWLRRQSRAFQDDVLGPTRGKLFREGGLSLDRFVDRNGKQINLKQLAQSDAAAFKAAGLDPSGF